MGAKQVALVVENLPVSGGNLESSAVATGLEKVSFHPNPKERQCQRIFKLLQNCTHGNILVKYCSKFSKPGFNSM